MDDVNDKNVVETTKKETEAIVGKSLASTPKTGELPSAKKTVRAVEKSTKTNGKAKPAEPVKGKRISHLWLGPELLRKHATEKEINKAFTDSFHSRGIKDQEWINKRIAIYMNIARKKLELAKSAAKAKAAKKSA